jgi:phospholipase B1
MKESKEIDFANDWKLVTLFIGGNDLCALCKDPEHYSPANYVKFVGEGIDYLQANLPRTFVNLVMTVNITDIRLMNKGVCAPLHKSLCKCGAYPADAAAEQILQDNIRGYHDMTRELVASGRYDNRDDFTVVLQPFFQDYAPPRKADNKIDYTYWAPDCFHFSDKGHGKYIS